MVAATDGSYQVASGTSLLVSAGLIIASAIVVKRLLFKKDMMKVKIPNIPGPEVGDELYNKVLSTRHHGMIECHEQFGELF